MQEWLKVALRRDVVMRGLKVGLVVGTLLTIINQGELLLAGNFTTTIACKILLTYLVPYGVSTYAGVSSIIAQRDESTRSMDSSGQE